MASFDPPSTLKPAEVAATMVQHGLAKHRTRADILFFKAFLAGNMLSYGGLLSEIISGGSPALTASNPGLVKVLGGAVFPVGLIMIVLQGQELLTSNMMIFPMAILKGAVPWWSLPLNWLIVTFGNLVGSLFFAAILVKYTGIISTAPYDAYVISFALHKAQEPQWYQIFLRGIGCNWLVCIAIWQAAGARDTLSKIVAIWIPIMIFVSAGFDHVIANMFSVPLGIMFGAPMTAGYYIGKSLVPSYLGNVVGALLVALPATYFYLWDWRAGGLRGAEEGEGGRDSENGEEGKTYAVSAQGA
ncbi:Formate/nitrite transporter [Sparassis crispa]|uniref:Formate/nitrite transporter n=1 Tax=Sparassis crispa TaxID=139825 RepID=A0A401GHL4_9APHY|nr:Formate/nitrite transporter [Sparassis crispa]GBE81611.1 Formate/nitrite transporter [Sparassis crispa]